MRLGVLNEILTNASIQNTLYIIYGLNVQGYEYNLSIICKSSSSITLRGNVACNMMEDIAYRGIDRKEKRRQIFTNNVNICRRFFIYAHQGVNKKVCFSV